MILERNTWIFTLNKKNELKNPNTSGKWLIFGKEKYLKLLFKDINNLVDKGKIFQAKLSKFPSKNQTLVICIYADDTTKEPTWKELEKLRCKKRNWKYDSQTKEERKT